MSLYDLIIIGAGPAGIAAAIYAARKRIDFIVITEDIGGQAAYSANVENYLGYQFISGVDLISKFEEHIKKYNVEVKENEKVIEINKEKDIIIVKTNKDIYKSKTLIIASSKRSKELRIPGEKEFKNKGVSYCATCDAPLFEGKNVAVIGGGNSAFDAVLQLAKIANKIYLITNISYFTADAIMQEKVSAINNVSMLKNTQVLEILGDRLVNGIKIKRENREEVINVEGVFIEIGLLPNSDFAVGVDKNKNGEIIINSKNETNIEGIFAAGDVTNIRDKQIIIAAGEGAKATLSVFEYLSKK